MQPVEFVIMVRRIVIMTGSHPVIARISSPRDVPCLTNETLFLISETANHLIILGGGSINVEKELAHARRGMTVSLIKAAKI